MKRRRHPLASELLLTPTMTPNALLQRVKTVLVLLVALVAFAACERDGAEPVLLGKINPQVMSLARAAQNASTNGVTPLALDAVFVRINGETRLVSLEDDYGFAIADLPTGDVSFEIDVGGFAGSVTVRDVLFGELIEIEIIVEEDFLEIQVLRRIESEPELPPPSNGGVIEIDGSDIVYYLSPGVYEGDIIISGSDVTLIGPPACDTLLLGDLIVYGNDIRIINVEVAGGTSFAGNDIEFYQDCYGYGHGDDDDDD